MRAIGVDIGGTNGRSALIDLARGRVLERMHHTSFVGEPEKGLAALADDLRALAAHKQVPVGIAVAAQLDPARRKVLSAPNLRWDNFPLAAKLERLIGAPVMLENDVRAAAWGELRFGALREIAPSATAACAFWGSGIGGAVVAAGRVQSGSLSIAGEIGHLVYRAGGRLCGCGKRGCFEAYIGGHQLALRAKQKTPELFAAARAGEPKARVLVDEAIALFGLQLSYIVTLLDPAAIVIGGGIGLEVFSSVRPALEPHLLKIRAGKIRLLKTRLGDDAGLLGAAVAASEKARVH